jgi:hypothetical protein
MCLTVNTYKTRKEAREAFKKPLVAKKDIIVYKAVKTWYDATNTLVYITPYQGMTITLNTKYKVSRFSSKIINTGKESWYLEIHRGLHSYTKRGMNDKRRWNYSYLFIKSVIPS